MTAAMPGGGGGLLAVALAHGLILSVMVTATMHISGGQFNPSVSFALAVIRKQSWAQAIAYAAVQILGSICAAGALKMIYGGLPAAGGHESAVSVVQCGATLGGMGLHEGSVLILEIIATFMLMWSIMGSAVDPRGVGKSMAVGGFAIGLTVAGLILAIGPATGASMNPARSIGPALVMGGQAWTMHWVYWVGPLIGATLGAVTYKSAFGTGSDEHS
jgi:aquaporin TIP